MIPVAPRPEGPVTRRLSNPWISLPWLPHLTRRQWTRSAGKEGRSAGAGVTIQASPLRPPLSATQAPTRPRPQAITGQLEGCSGPQGAGPRVRRTIRCRPFRQASTRIFADDTASGGSDDLHGRLRAVRSNKVKNEVWAGFLDCAHPEPSYGRLANRNASLR